MDIYELYGYSGGTIEAAKKFIERAIGVEFLARDSGYHGAYFIYGDSFGEHLLLKENVDVIDGQAAEPESAEYPVLLYANEIESLTSLSQILIEKNGFVLLKREAL